jgi:hypothetical protein
MPAKGWFSSLGYLPVESMVLCKGAMLSLPDACHDGLVSSPVFRPA